MLFKAVFHTYALLVFVQMICSTRAYLNHFTNRRGRFYHLRKCFGHCSLLFCNCRILLLFGECFTTLTDGRDFYEAQKALLLFTKRFARWMRDKPTIKTHKVARRRRNFLRVSVTTIYFVKEPKHENSPPQAEIFKDLRR